MTRYVGVKGTVWNLTEHILHLFVLDWVNSQHNSSHTGFDSLILIIVKFKGILIDRKYFNPVIKEKVYSLLV
jgi:hypothetical protein